jgi:hypothetical protein
MYEVKGHEFDRSNIPSSCQQVRRNQIFLAGLLKLAEMRKRNAPVTGHTLDASHMTNCHPCKIHQRIGDRFYGMGDLLPFRVLNIL